MPLYITSDPRVERTGLVSLITDSLRDYWGSGKSKLLSVLARCTSVIDAGTQGNVTISGRNPGPRTFRHVSASVEREDALVDYLAVRETLNLAALPATTSKAEHA